MQNNELVARLLRQLAAALDRLGPGQLEDILSGEAHLAVVTRGRRLAKREHTSDSVQLARLQRLATQLRELSSREEGWDLLRREDLTKKELEKLARILDLPVLREDDAERLRLKIVEQCIGSRLNSRAIRG
jgi:hypothetical protein